MMKNGKIIFWGLIGFFVAFVILAASCHQSRPTATNSTESKEDKAMTTVSVRYIVDDVDAAVEFYTKLLNFKVDMRPAPGFASLSRGNLQLLLNLPGAGGAGQAMPDGSKPAPGGWNRIRIEVADLASEVERLRREGAHFRNDIVTGNGGQQILLDDPAGNPIELFEPGPPQAR